MTRDDRWNLHYKEVRRFITRKKQIPSKHRPEEHKMLNWIKYNRKLFSRQELSPEREKKFRQLMELASKYHRINQYAYVTPEVTELELFPKDK
ncbi:MAG: helicase associated domain-containing protein [Prevotella sp.]|nr:helicase associated domain-containing protein [Prevotella sp.]